MELSGSRRKASPSVAREPRWAGSAISDATSPSSAVLLRLSFSFALGREAFPSHFRVNLSAFIAWAAFASNGRLRSLALIGDSMPLTR